MTIKELLALPLSQLLRVAVQDCRAVEKDPKAALNMHIWHAPLRGRDYGGLDDLDDLVREILVENPEAECAMCMAGAVLDQTLRFDRTKPYEMGSSAPDYRRLVWRIDQLRRGIVINTWSHDLWQISVRTQNLIRMHWDHDADRAPWKIYEQMADILESEGL